MRWSLVLKRKEHKDEETQIPDTAGFFHIGKKKQILILSRPLLYCFLFKKILDSVSKQVTSLPGVISSFLYPPHFMSLGKAQFWCHRRQDWQPVCPLVAEKDSLSPAEHLSQGAQWV